MIRNLMILVLIILLGYIFYSEFMADSLEPFFKRYAEKPVFYQVRDPKIAAETEIPPGRVSSTADVLDLSQ
jgi:predicted nicotinamide N-methyase